MRTDTLDRAFDFETATMDECIAAAEALPQHGEAALAAWTHVRNRFPENPVGPVKCFNVLGRLGRNDEAERIAAEAAAAFPDDQWVAEERGWLAENRRDLTLAATRWQDFRERFPDSNEGWIRGGSVLRDLREYAQADLLLEQALRRAPGDAQVLAAYCWTASIAADWPEATRRWAVMLDRFPENPDGHSRYGEALLELGRFDEADAQLQRAGQRFPDDAEIAMTYARVAERRGDYPEAISRSRAANQRFNDNPYTFSSFGWLLLEADRAEEADLLLCEAAARFPDNEAVIYTHAFAASQQSHWLVALERWRAARARFPHSMAIFDGHGKAAWHAQIEGVVVPVEQTVSGLTDEHGAPLSDRDLMMHFESLGDNCEFGVVQRKMHADPLGLLRWTSTTPKTLALALDHRFEGVGDEGDTELMFLGEEYEVISRRYEFYMHSFIRKNVAEEPKILAQQTARFRYLRRKLLEDLDSHEKMFVFKKSSGMTLHEADMINEAIKAYGANALLCVLLADDLHPNGTVVRRGELFVVAYIERLSQRALDTEIDYASWIPICRQAYRLWRAEV